MSVSTHNIIHILLDTRAALENLLETRGKYTDKCKEQSLHKDSYISLYFISKVTLSLTLKTMKYAKYLIFLTEGHVTLFAYYAYI